MPFGPVRTFGPIPPMRQRFARLWAPPVHEATGGYAVRRAQGHAVIIQSEKEKIAQALSGPISINEMYLVFRNNLKFYLLAKLGLN